MCGVTLKCLESALSILYAMHGQQPSDEVEDSAHDMAMPRLVESLSFLTLPRADHDLVTGFQERKELVEFLYGCSPVGVTEKYVSTIGLKHACGDSDCLALVLITYDAQAWELRCK